MKKKPVNAALASRVNAIVARHAEQAVLLRHGQAPAGAEKHAWYNFVDKGTEETDLFILDEISSFWGVSANDFVRDLQAVNAKTINLYLNSPGGSVFEGYAIYTALVRHAATINVFVDGWAASIASVIAMAGDKIKIGAHAEIMIHKPSSFAYGTADDMRTEAEVLDSIEDAIVDIYEARTGADRDEIVAWVNDETWFRGQKAVDAGFADEVIPLKTKGAKDDEAKATPSASADVAYFEGLITNLPTDLRAVLAAADTTIISSERAAQPTAEKVKTPRQFEDFLRASGFSSDASKSIASKGFKPKTEPRDGAAEAEHPTATEPRDGAEKRDATIAAVRLAANLAAIRSAAASH